ncbi:MAG: c-type cytochrome [Deltaproteobacteria bacterium]|nr:c-type cytochrome [Deltaproteobacteria bacterium]
MFRERLFWALAGVVFPISFLVPLWLPADPPSKSERLTPAESRGKIIYTRGRSPSGNELSFWLVGGGQRLPAGGVTCATCHGEDGQGGREGNLIVTPDITYEALTKPGHVTLPSGRKRVPYTDVLLARAITQGLDSSGQKLNLLMPRWNLTGSDLQDLIAYLKRLRKEPQ